MDPRDRDAQDRQTAAAERLRRQFSGEQDARGSGGMAVAGVGIQFAVALVVFGFLGQWLDRRLGTAPVFLLVCVLLGGGAAFYGMYKRLTAAQRRENEVRLARAREAASAAGTPTPPEPGSGK